MPEDSAKYQKPEIPPGEEERIKELHGLKLLDTASDVRFDRYTSLVADIFDFPIVLVTLVDSNRQWFKSSCGLKMRQSSRDISFCAHAINQNDVLVIPDARQDPRFAGNPMVTGYPYIRFYAGAVVHSPNGQPLGTLCVIDHQKHDFSDRQCDQLRGFADLVEGEIQHTQDLDRLRASVEYSAYYDAITGLPNQRLLTDRLSKLLELAELERRRVVVLLFNISKLRLLNQSLGTQVGDDLLNQVGQRLSQCCPPGGTVARLQADEFALAFPSHNQRSANFDTAIDKARAELELPFTLNGSEHYIHVQTGGSIFPDHGTTPAVLIERASAAIRFNGEGTPHGIQFYNKAESVDIAARLRIESCLRGAVEKKQFSLLYQPIVSIADGHLASVEALIRWEHPELGMVPPDQFIPVAEQTGLIASIGHWVQKEVCRQIKDWKGHSNFEIPVSINVSAGELLQPDFARDFLDRLKASEIEPQQVWIEVTESSLISDYPAVDQNLAQISNAGISINIDDFGTGYSSLSYLRRLPLRRLKIDKSFILGIPDTKHAIALTNTIISMTKELELDTVAEGVETVCQLEFLRKTECRYGQGYLMSRPIAADRIPLLKGHSLI